MELDGKTKRIEDKRGRRNQERRGKDVTGCKHRLTACKRGVMTLIKYHPAFTLPVIQFSFIRHFSFQLSLYLPFAC